MAELSELVLQAVASPKTRTNYARALRDFGAWYATSEQCGFNKHLRRIFFVLRSLCVNSRRAGLLLSLLAGEALNMQILR